MIANFFNNLFSKVKICIFSQFIQCIATKLEMNSFLLNDFTVQLKTAT